MMKFPTSGEVCQVNFFWNALKATLCSSGLVGKQASVKWCFLPLHLIFLDTLFLANHQHTVIQLSNYVSAICPQLCETAHNEVSAPSRTFKLRSLLSRFT